MADSASSSIVATLSSRLITPHTRSDNCLIIESINNLYRTVYHITPWLVDPSIPVLWFNLYNEHSELITNKQQLQEILEIDPVKTVVSQGEHPVYGYPAFFLHPCETSTFFDDLNAPSRSAELALWLTTYGSYVGLTGLRFKE